MGETRIRQALELLDGGRRWTKDNAGHVGKARCMMVALGEVWSNYGGRFQPDRNAVSQVICDNYGADRYWDGERISPACFNDHPDTTFADVELVMEKAAIMREEAVE